MLFRSELREANRLQCSEQRLYSRLPKLDQIPTSYQLVDAFLQGLEKEAKSEGRDDDLLGLAFSQMAVHVQMHYTDLLDKRYPQSEHTYQNLVTVMIGSVAAEQPEQYLARALKELKLTARTAWSVYAEVRRVHRAYESLCQRLAAVPRYAEKDFVLFFLRCLDPVSADSLRRTAPQRCHEDLYAMAQYATEIEGRLAADTALPLPAPGQAAQAALPPLADLAAQAQQPGISASHPAQLLAPAASQLFQQPAALQPAMALQPAAQQQNIQQFGGQQQQFQQQGIQQMGAQQISRPQQQGIQQRGGPLAGGQPAAGQQQWSAAGGSYQPQRRWRPPRSPQGPWGMARGGKSGVHAVSRPWQPRAVMFAGAAPAVPSVRPSPSAPLPSAGGWFPCFSCGGTGHRLVQCPKYAQECANDPSRYLRCAGCNVAGPCPADCRRRLFFTGLGVPFVEVQKNGKTHFLLCDRPFPAWYHPSMSVQPPPRPVGGIPSAPHFAVAQRVAPPPPVLGASAQMGVSVPSPPVAQVPTQTAPVSAAPAVAPTPPVQQPTVWAQTPVAQVNLISLATAEAQEVPGAESEVVARPCGGHGPEVADGPKSEAATVPVEEAAQEGGRPLTTCHVVTDVCNHRSNSNKKHDVSATLNKGTVPELRLAARARRAQHLRAIVFLNGKRVEAVIDTGSDVTLLSSRILPSGVPFKPWTAKDGQIYGVAQHGLTVVGRAVLEVRLGPLREKVSFLVVLGIICDVILGVDFLCEHDIAVQPLRHHLILQGHGNVVYPLLGPSPQYKHSCMLQHDVSVPPGGKVLIGVAPPQEGDVPRYVARRWDRQAGLFVPDQTIHRCVEVQNFSGNILYLPAGWHLARAFPIRDSRLQGPPHTACASRAPLSSAAAPLLVCRVAVELSAGAAESSSTLHDPAVGIGAAPKSGASETVAATPVAVSVCASTPARSADEVAVNSDSAPEPRSTLEGVQDSESSKEAPAYMPTEDGFFMPAHPSPNSCLTEAEIVSLRALLFEFRDRFNDGTRPLAATNLLRARLDTGDAPPVSFPPRRLSPAMREVVRNAVAELDAKGITEPGVGCWGSPIVMVKKSSGAWRLCCDYREVNKHVVIPQQPLPRTDDILASFNNKRYFSVMDMCNGFYQIEIEEEDRPKTGFVTPDCQRQYKRLPFGFASSPAIFQRMVDMLLGGMKWVSAVGYIDDIIVYSDTWQDHLKHLRELFEALRRANLELHPAKCAFGASEVKYLGHIVSREGIRASPAKVRAILDMPVPTSAKHVQRFIGKCQYYRKFIPDFSRIAAPLFRVQTRARDFQWSAECQRAWDQLKAALVSEPLLAHPDYTRDFLLDCDGSGEGLGAVLLQQHDQGERVIAYASRSLLDHEKKWTATELEAAALIWALETFRPYIEGVHVTIRTDHAPLEYIKSKTNKCKRLERWALRLQEFRFTIQPRPGSQQKHVDALSRAPVPVEPGQAPIELDVFPDRVVLRVAAWEAQPASARMPPARAKFTFPGSYLQDIAVRAVRQRRQPVRRSPRLNMPRASESDDSDIDLCEVALSEDEDDESEVPIDSAEPQSERAGHTVAARDSAEGQTDSTAPARESEAREYEDCPTPPVRPVSLPLPVHHDDLLRAQQSDEDCARFRALHDMPREEWPRTWAPAGLRFLIVSDILCVILEGSSQAREPATAAAPESNTAQASEEEGQGLTSRPRIVLPEIFRQRAIHAHHLSYYGGHFGCAKTCARLAVRYWWPTLRADVKAYMARCGFCLAHSPFTRAWRWLSLPIGTPFEVVAADIFGPLKPTERGNLYILVIIDHHTRWVELVPMPDPTAEIVAQAIFEQWISRWGVMRALLTDNGRQFTARLLRQLTDVYGIKRIFASPYNPRDNAIVESYMRSLKTALKLCIDVFKADWDFALQAAALAYRATPHTVTGFSPYFLVTGQEVVLPLSREWNEPALCLSGVTWLEALWRCRTAVLKAHRRIADTNERVVRAQGTGLAEGAIVALKLTKEERRADGKMAPLYQGPYEVVRVLPAGVTAEIRCALTGAVHTVNRARLKLLQVAPAHFPSEPDLSKPQFR